MTQKPVVRVVVGVLHEAVRLSKRNGELDQNAAMEFTLELTQQMKLQDVESLVERACIEFSTRRKKETSPDTAATESIHVDPGAIESAFQILFLTLRSPNQLLATMLQARADERTKREEELVKQKRELLQAGIETVKMMIEISKTGVSFPDLGDQSQIDVAIFNVEKFYEAVFDPNTLSPVRRILIEGTAEVFRHLTDDNPLQTLDIVQQLQLQQAGVIPKDKD